LQLLAFFVNLKNSDFLEEAPGFLASVLSGFFGLAQAEKSKMSD